MKRFVYLAGLLFLAAPAAARAQQDLSAHSLTVEVCNQYGTCESGLPVGRTARIGVSISNNGPDAVAAFPLDVWLSQDGTVDPATDISLLSEMAGPIEGTPAGATPPTTQALQYVAQIPWDLPPGDWTVIVQVDGADLIVETDETNNVVVGTARTMVAAPELSADGATLSWCHEGTGECGIHMSWVADSEVTVTNAGPQGTVFTLAMYLTHDGILDVGDDSVDRVIFPKTEFYIGPADVDGTTGALIPNTITLPIEVNVPYFKDPAADGYHVAAFVDVSDDIVESDEDDNVFIGTERHLIHRSPSLNVIQVEPPKRLFLGREATIRFTLVNNGEAPAEFFNYGVFLSTDDLVQVNRDFRIGSGHVESIVRNSVVTFDVPVTIPASLPPRDWYVGVGVDLEGWLPEAKANNQRVAKEPVPVLVPAADLTVRDLKVPALVSPGETAVVAVTLENDGVVPTSDFSFGLYASANPLITTHDLLLAEGSTSLLVGERKIVNLRVPIPKTLDQGAMYLGAYADHLGVIAELDEGNNDGIGGRPIEVVAPELGITTPYVPEAFVGRVFSWRFAAAGGAGDYAWSVAAGELPPGLTLDPATGVLAGTPSEAGAWPVALQVASGGMTNVRTFTLRVLAPQVSLAVASSDLPAALLQQPYEVKLAALGGTAPYTWSGTNLPTGLSLSSDGFIRGMATEIGTRLVDVQVRDARGSLAVGTLELLVADGSRLTITTRYILPAYVGERYFAGFEAAGGRDPLVWSLNSGALPPGITLDSATGLLQGEPSRAGTYAFQVAVTDSQGLFDTNNVTLDVMGQPIKIVDPKLPEAAVNEPYEAKITVLPTAGVPPFVWSIRTGALPDGMTLDADTGVLSGTPTVGGTWPLVIGVEDSVGNSGRHPVALVVTDAASARQFNTEPDAPGCSSVGGNAGWMAVLLALMGLVKGRGRRTAAGLVAGAVLAVAPAAHAADWSYSVHRQPKAYAPLTGATDVPLSGTAKLQFQTFRFYDQPVSSLTLSQHGILVFGDDLGDLSSNSSIPNAAAPNGFVAPWWDELTRGSGTVRQRVAADGAFVLEFDDWKVDASRSDATVDFQVRLDPATNDIQVHYGEVQGTTNLSTATVGIEGWNGLKGLKGLECSPKCTEKDFPSHTLVTYSARPNLTLENFQTPPSGQAGVGLPVSALVRNVGGQATDKFWVRAILSEDAVLDASDVELSGGVQLSLAPRTDKAVNFYAALPHTVVEGQAYWVFLEVNGVRSVGEYTYDDNHTEGLRVVIDPPSPDFTTSFVSGPGELKPGVPVGASIQLHNRGNLAGEAEWRVVASRNTYISPEDVALASGSANLQAKEYLNLSPTLEPPAQLPTGLWYLGVIVDPSNLVTEPGEQDNTAILRNASGSPLVVRVGTDTATVVPSAPDSLPYASVGVPYSFALQLVGGDGTATWAAYNTSALPPGLTLSKDGRLHGIPTQAGQYAWQVWATTKDTTGNFIPTGANVKIEVFEVGGALTVVTQEVPDAILSQEYAVQLLGVGGEGPYQWGVSGALPGGMTLSEGGALGGAPRETGSFPISVTLTDSVGGSATVALTLRVAEAGNLVITNTDLHPAKLGQPYQVRLVASGGIGSYVWDIESALPEGLSLDRLGGVISGTPRQVGIYDLSVKVSDAANRFDTNTYRLIVDYDQGLSVTSLRLPTASLNRLYETQLEAIGGVEPYRWGLTGEGNLPADFELSEDGVLRGTPVDIEEPVYAFIVTVTDAEGRKGMSGLSLRVQEPPAVLEPEGCSAAGGSAGFALLLVGAASLVGRRRRRLRA